MRKHRVNRAPGIQTKSQRKTTFSRASALGIAVAAAVALSGAPGVGATNAQLAPVATPNVTAAQAVFVQPVNVSLLSDVDAISWDALQFTSSDLERELAEGSNAASASGIALGPNAAGEQARSTVLGQASPMLVGQNVGTLGELPGNLQLIHPITSRHITSPYGWRHNPTGAGSQIHIGQDYAISCGSPVYAAEDGTVIQSAWAGHSGMRVTIDHGYSVRTGYSHNSKLIARVGDAVKQGQLIALSGTTGNSTGCHVHFEVIINGKWNDPRNFLPAIPGQPNPMIYSRDTTITAEVIRNYGTPRSGSVPMQDLELNIPWKSQVSVVEPVRVPETKKAESKKTTEKPVVKHDPVRAPKPSAKPIEKPKPKPKPTQEPVSKPKPSSTQPAKPVQPKPTVAPSPTKPPVAVPTEIATPTKSPAKPTPAPSTTTPPTPVPSPTKPTGFPSPTTSPTTAPSPAKPEPSKPAPSPTKPTVAVPAETSPTAKPTKSASPKVPQPKDPAVAEPSLNTNPPADKTAEGKDPVVPTPPSEEPSTNKVAPAPKTVEVVSQVASGKPVPVKKPSAPVKPAADQKQVLTVKDKPAKGRATAKLCEDAADPLALPQDQAKTCTEDGLPLDQKAVPLAKPHAKPNEPADG